MDNKLLQCELSSVELVSICFFFLLPPNYEVNFQTQKLNKRIITSLMWGKKKKIPARDEYLCTDQLLLEWVDVLRVEQLQETRRIFEQQKQKKKGEVSTNCLYVAVNAISDDKLTTGIQSFSYLLARLTCIETNMAAWSFNLIYDFSNSHYLFCTFSYLLELQ